MWKIGQRYQTGHSTGRKTAVGRIQKDRIILLRIAHNCLTNSWKAASRPTEDLVETNLQRLFFFFLIGVGGVCVYVYVCGVFLGPKDKAEERPEEFGEGGGPFSFRERSPVPA